MGWYGEEIKCPKCKGQTSCQFRNSGDSQLYLLCPHCGLVLYCAEKEWTTTASYIDESLKGKSEDDMEAICFDDYHENDGVIDPKTHDYTYRDDGVIPVGANPWTERT